MEENERDMLLSKSRLRQKSDAHRDLDVATVIAGTRQLSRQELDDALDRSSALVLTTTPATGGQFPPDGFDVLNEAELARHRSFASAPLASRFAATRIALRRLLGSLLDLPPGNVEIHIGPNGKPMLAEPASVWFNVAHTDNLSLIALSRSNEVGVDIERIRPIAMWEQVADRVLDDSERASLRESVAAGSDPSDALLVQWCRLEAELKAMGVGLGSHHTRSAVRATGTLRVVDLNELPLPADDTNATASRYRAAVALWSPT